MVNTMKIVSVTIPFQSSSDSRTQTALFEQTKTVIEAEMEVMRSAKEAGGNAQVRTEGKGVVVL